MRMLTWRGWVLAAVIGVVAATLTFLTLLQIAHWRTDEAQLHQIVQLIQQGRLQVSQGPPAAPQPAPQVPPK